MLRGRERTVGEVIEEMFASMPSPEPWITGDIDAQQYLDEANAAAEPFRQRVAELLQPTYNEGALLQQDRIRAGMNEQLRRVRSPLRLTDADGDVTKATAAPQTVGGVNVGMSPTAQWAPVGVEAFNSVNAASVDYAKFRSGTLVTNMLEEQQRVVRELIGDSFTTARTDYKNAVSAHLLLRLADNEEVTMAEDRRLLNDSFVNGLSMVDMRILCALREVAREGGEKALWDALRKTFPRKESESAGDRADDGEDEQTADT